MGDEAGDVGEVVPGGAVEEETETTLEDIV